MDVELNLKAIAEYNDKIKDLEDQVRSIREVKRVLVNQIATEQAEFAVGDRVISGGKVFEIARIIGEEMMRNAVKIKSVYDGQIIRKDGTLGLVLKRLYGWPGNPIRKAENG